MNIRIIDVAERSYPASKARCGSREEQPRVRGQGWRPGGATPRPRIGAATEARGSGQEEQSHAQGVVAVRAQGGLEEPYHAEDQEGWWEEIPLVQEKEQWLCSAGAAMKRYSTPKVRETQERW